MLTRGLVSTPSTSDEAGVGHHIISTGDTPAPDLPATKHKKITEQGPFSIDSEKTQGASDKSDGFTGSGSQQMQRIIESDLPNPKSDTNPNRPKDSDPNSGENMPIIKNNAGSHNTTTSSVKHYQRPHLRLETPTQPHHHTENSSPKQRKKVAFVLPSPSNTVPITPNTGSPPPLPDNASSSSASDPALSPAASTRPPYIETNSSTSRRRPPLHRASHSSSSYTPNARSHTTAPPRSASNKDLPLNEGKPPNRAGKGEESDQQNHNPVPTNHCAESDRMRRFFKIEGNENHPHFHTTEYFPEANDHHTRRRPINASIFGGPTSSPSAAPHTHQQQTADTIVIHKPSRRL